MRGALVATVLLLATAGAASGATRLDRHGTILLDGRPTFPIVLAKAPPADGLGELAAAGVNFVKVGPAGPWTDAELADAIAANRAAAAHGLHTWVNLSSLSAATPGAGRRSGSGR